MQVRIAIVEDNPIMLRAIQSTIRWEEINCVIVGTATNGENGRKLLLEQKPDILLTDIRMPQMDGLSMLEAVTEQLPEMKTIVITGYSEFQYASRAIKLAVCDYILKPVRNEELIRAVQRAIRLLHRENENKLLLEQTELLRRKAQLLLLLNNEARPGLDVHRILKEVGMFSSSFYLMVMLADDPQWIMMSILNGLDDLLRSLSGRATSVVVDNAVVIYAMLPEGETAWQEDAERIARKLASTLPVSLSIGISPRNTSHHHIRELYQQVRMMTLEKAASASNGNVFFLDPADGYTATVTDQQQFVQQLAEKLQLTEHSAQETSQQLFAFCHGDFSRMHSLLSMLFINLLQRYDCPDKALLDKALDAALSPVSSREDLTACIDRVLKTLRPNPAENQTEEAAYSLVVKEALAYIRLHAAEPLKLREVADHFFISANYLSTLIHQETGTSYYQHVLRAKMDIARTMLADPRVRAEDVAYAIGYSTYSAFFNAFQRTEHMSPTEYRNRQHPSVYGQEG